MNENPVIDVQMRIDRWLYDRLTTNQFLIAKMPDSRQNFAGLARVYNTIAPQKAIWPFVLYSHIGDIEDTQGLGAFSYMERAVYMVKVVDRGHSFESLKEISDEIVDMLHRADGTYDDCTIMSCVRISGIPPRHQIIDGIEERNVGHKYSILAQPTQQ